MLVPDVAGFHVAGDRPSSCETSIIKCGCSNQVIQIEPDKPEAPALDDTTRLRPQPASSVNTSSVGVAVSSCRVPDIPLLGHSRIQPTRQLVAGVSVFPFATAPDALCSRAVSAWLAAVRAENQRGRHRPISRADLLTSAFPVIARTVPRETPLRVLFGTTMTFSRTRKPTSSPENPPFSGETRQIGQYHLSATPKSPENKALFRCDGPVSLSKSPFDEESITAMTKPNRPEQPKPGQIEKEFGVPIPGRIVPPNNGPKLL